MTTETGTGIFTDNALYSQDELRRIAVLQKRLGLLEPKLLLNKLDKAKASSMLRNVGRGAAIGGGVGLLYRILGRPDNGIPFTLVGAGIGGAAGAGVNWLSGYLGEQAADKEQITEDKLRNNINMAYAKPSLSAYEIAKLNGQIDNFSRMPYTSGNEVEQPNASL